MRTPWTSKLAVTLLPRFWFDTAGLRAVMQFGRLNYNDDENVRYRIVAEADGPVLEAFLQLNVADTGCELLDQDVRDNRYVFSVLGDSWSGPIGTYEGVIAGEAGEGAPVTLKLELEPNLHRSWRVSSSWIVEKRGTVLARPWSGSTQQKVYAPGEDPEKMPSYGVIASGDAVFLQIGVSGYNAVLSWTATDGLRNLLRWPGDWTRGAGNFNTDGVHMVWTYGEGKAADATPEYPVRSIMTAPFTTDPIVLTQTAKRLRSDPGQMSPYPFGMGCGYAVRRIWTPGSPGVEGSNDLLVVRISDGHSWVVSAPPVTEGMSFDRALGATCTDVFATANFKDESQTIVRIAIDSLGVGVPAD